MAESGVILSKQICYHCPCVVSSRGEYIAYEQEVEARQEVNTAVITNITVFWDVMCHRLDWYKFTGVSENFDTSRYRIYSLIRKLKATGSSGDTSRKMEVDGITL